MSLQLFSFMCLALLLEGPLKCCLFCLPCSNSHQQSSKSRGNRAATRLKGNEKEVEEKTKTKKKKTTRISSRNRTEKSLATQNCLRKRDQHVLLSIISGTQPPASDSQPGSLIKDFGDLEGSGNIIARKYRLNEVTWRHSAVLKKCSNSWTFYPKQSRMCSCFWSLTNLEAAAGNSLIWC